MQGNRVDIVDIGAGLDRKLLVPASVGADIGQFAKFLAARGAGREIFIEAASRAGRSHDVLNQQPALAILELPSIHVHVFGIAVHIGDAGIGVSRAVNADIVGIFAPAHGADRSECGLTCLIGRDLSRLGFVIVTGQNLLRRFHEIAHGRSPLVEHGVAQHHYLRHGDGEERNRKDRDDHRQTLVDREMAHPLDPRLGNLPVSINLVLIRR